MAIKGYPKRFAVALLIGAAFAALDRPTSAQDDAESDKPSAEQLLQEKLQRVFQATSVTVAEGSRIVVVYDFESKNESLTQDWLPAIEKMEQRVRWARGTEGTYTTVEHGLILGDHGIWLHKALWQDLSMSVRYLSMSGIQSGDLIVAGFSFNKDKSIAGSNLGTQCVRLSGERLADKPIPATFPTTIAEKEYNFGMELKDGVLTATKDGRETANTKEKPKFLKDLTSGHAALVWKGRVNGFLFKITLEGTLDPEWLKKQ